MAGPQFQGAAGPRSDVLSQCDKLKSGNGERAKLRAVVICTRFRPGRTASRSRHFMQPTTGLQIASRLDPAIFNVELYHEDWHGPYPAEAPGGADIVFLTGLQIEFDRMRQLSYAFRRRGALTVAGGSICSLFPEFSSQFFDVVCAGGVDAVTDVATDFVAGTVKPIYRSAYLKPRDVHLDYGLLARAGIRSKVHFLESSRGCSFKCAFCVMPTEAGGHVAYAVASTRLAIDDAIAASPRFSLRRWFPHIVFVDNNFSDDRKHLEAMIDMLKEHPNVHGWSAMITQNMLGDRALLQRIAAGKCRHLFVGLESLDPEALRRYNKKQNLGRRSVLDDVAYAERLGISIGYGYLFDPRFQTAAAMEQDLRMIIGTPALPMPAFLSLISPLAGTASFWEDVREGRLAPGLRLRDLDGETIAYRRLADTPAAYASAIARLLYRPWDVTGRWAVLRKVLARIVLTRSWNPLYWWTIVATGLHSLTRGISYANRRATYMAGEAVLDPQYTAWPADLTAEDYHRYFEPVAITDAEGQLMPWLKPYAPTSADERPQEAA